MVSMELTITKFGHGPTLNTVFYMETWLKSSEWIVEKIGKGKILNLDEIELELDNLGKVFQWNRW